MWGNIKFRRYISIGITGLLALFACFLCIDPFSWEIFQQAIRLGPSRVSWNWTGIVVAISIFLITHLLRLRNLGWGGMRKAWKENISASLFAALVVYCALFCYSAAMVIRQIDKDAQSTKAPPIRYPTSPPDRPPSPKMNDERKSLEYMKDDGLDTTIDIGPSPEPNYAYETRFILINSNPHGIANAFYICETQKIDRNKKLPGLIVPWTPSPARTMALMGDVPAHSRFSIYCDFAQDPWANELERPELTIWVSYEYGRKKLEQGFRFLAIPTQDGKHNFIWLPRGRVEGPHTY